MRRRELLLLLATGIIGSRAVRGQQKAMPVIGYLGSTSRGPFAMNMAAFHQGLNETGYVEGHTWRSNTAGPRITMTGCPHWPLTSSLARST